jgi:hypothetical protein
VDAATAAVAEAPVEDAMELEETIEGEEDKKPEAKGKSVPPKKQKRT